MWSWMGAGGNRRASLPARHSRWGKSPAGDRALQIPGMQTTLRLDDELYRQAKVRAAALGMSLTKFLEAAIRDRLAAPPAVTRRRRLRLPVSTATGGLAPGFSTLEAAAATADLACDLKLAS